MMRTRIALSAVCFFLAVCSSAQADTAVTTFCYDWCQGRNGSGYTAVPFFLDGYGSIKEKEDLEEVLDALKKLEERTGGFGAQAVVWKELSVHKLSEFAGFLPDGVTAETFGGGEISIVPTLVKTRSGSHLWLFAIKKDNVVGIIRQIAGKD